MEEVFEVVAGVYGISQGADMYRDVPGVLHVEFIKIVEGEAKPLGKQFTASGFTGSARADEEGHVMKVSNSIVILRLLLFRRLMI
jgi:hypothetical protein